jgi:hypothetical protein
LPHSSNSASPYCYGYTWPDISATLWECDALSAYTKDTVLLTFNGETDDRHWTAEYNTGASTSSLGGILTGANSLHSSAPGSHQTPAPSAPTKAAKSTSVGAIVGGVVGGLAVIGATAFGVIFLLLRKRKQRHDAAGIAAAAAAGNSNNAAAAGPYNPNVGTGASGAAGYYDHDNKPQMTPMTAQMAPQQQQQPKYEQYSPYQDNSNNRVSTFSEASHPSTVPPYQPPYQPPPMELDGASALPHHGVGGQPIYEVPAGHN